MMQDIISPEERKRRVRRTALWLALLAIGLYVGFIAMSVTRSG